MTIVYKMIEYLNHLWYHILKIYKARGSESMSKINERLENMAKDILIANDMLKLPVNLTEIAKNNNIEIYVSELPREISGAIRYNKDKNNFEILVQEKDSFLRQRFTVAHELAHFFLQKDLLTASEEIHIDTLYRKEKNEQEREMDYLAGAILMNKEIIIRLYKINQSTRDLADACNVSEAAMSVRLSILNL